MLLRIFNLLMSTLIRLNIVFSNCINISALHDIKLLFKLQAILQMLYFIAMNKTKKLLISLVERDYTVVYNLSSFSS